MECVRFKAHRIIVQLIRRLKKEGLGQLFKEQEISCQVRHLLNKILIRQLITWKIIEDQIKF